MCVLQEGIYWARNPFTFIFLSNFFLYTPCWWFIAVITRGEKNFEKYPNDARCLLEESSIFTIFIDLLDKSSYQYIWRWTLAWNHALLRWNVDVFGGFDLCSPEASRGPEASRIGAKNRGKKNLDLLFERVFSPSYLSSLFFNIRWSPNSEIDDNEKLWKKMRRNIRIVKKRTKFQKVCIFIFSILRYYFETLDSSRNHENISS